MSSVGTAVSSTHTGAAVSAHGDPSQLIGQLSNPYSIRETRVVKTNSNLNTILTKLFFCSQTLPAQCSLRIVQDGGR